MAKRTISIDTDTTDGIGNEAVQKPTNGTIVGGNTEPQGGASEPERTASPTRIAGFESVSPVDVGTGDSGAGKRKGRPPGIKNRTTETKKTSDLVADLESLILSFNLGIAALLVAPEFEAIDEEKNKAVANSIRGLAALYSKSLNPKTVAWANFGMAVASAYGPPVYMVYKRAEVAPKPISGPVVVAPRPRTNGQAVPDLGASIRNAESLVNEAARQQMSPSQLWAEPGASTE